MPGEAHDVTGGTTIMVYPEDSSPSTAPDICSGMRSSSGKLAFDMEDTSCSTDRISSCFTQPGRYILKLMITVQNVF